jgi:hypothetical protein
MPVTARQNATQQVHYIRYNFAFNTVGATAIQQSMGAAVPAGAQIVGVTIAIPTAFNAGTTNTLDVGTAAAPTALISAAALGSAAISLSQPATLQGQLSASADTELFVRYNFTGTTPTAGAATVVVAYVPNI